MQGIRPLKMLIFHTVLKFTNLLLARGLQLLKKIYWKEIKSNKNWQAS